MGQGCQETLLRYLPEEFLAEIAADGLQFIGDGGVFAGEICVPRAGVQDAHGVLVRRQIQVDLLHRRIGGVGKINSHYAAYRGGGLVHQPAGLAEKDVLRVLPDLGNFHSGGPALPEEVVQHGAYQHLKGGGGTEAAAAGDVGNEISVQPGVFQGTAQSGHPGSHAAD